MYTLDKDVLPSRIEEEGLRIDVYPAAEVPDQYVEQLIQKSRQPHVMEYEGHEDAEGRFKDIESYRSWAGAKQRIVYLLVSPSHDVGGIIWFGERENPLAPGYGVTFGIRLYDKDEEKGWNAYLGKGLAVPFMQATHTDAAKHFPNQGLWLDYVKGNEAAERTYTKFGYEKIAEEDGRIVMGNKTAFAAKKGKDE